MHSEQATPVVETQRNVGPGRGFWLLWSANSASNLGDGLYQFLLPLLAIQLTSTPSMVAGVNVMLSLAWLFFALPAGSIVDRANRRNVLLGVTISRLVLLLILFAAILSGQLSLWLIYLIALLLGIGETLADTALIAVVPAVTPAERLEQANAYLTGAQSVTNNFIGPPLAGYLAGLGMAWVSGASTLMYALTGLALGFLAIPRQPLPKAQPGMAKHITEGLRFLWQHRLIRYLTIFTAAMNIWWAGWSALFILHAIAPGPMQLDSFGYGLLLTAMALGGTLGSLLCAPLSKWLGLRNALLIDFIGTLALVGVPLLSTNPIVIGISLFLAGMGAVIWVILVASLRQRLVPEQLLGRVYSASRMISWGVNPIGALAAGFAANHWGIPAVFMVGSICSIIMLILFLLVIRPSDLE